MNVPPLTLRIPKGAPLTAAEMDENLRRLRDFANALSALYEIVFNADGTFKNDSVLTAAIKDRQITQSKLDWLANFYGVAIGTDTYSVTINPTAAFTYGDGVAGSFVCVIKFPNTNTGACTLNVNAAGAKPIVKLGGSALLAGEIIAGSIHWLSYDGADFQLLSAVAPPSPASLKFVSAETAIPVTDTTLNWPHGLSATPRWLRSVLVCKQADTGYAVGDEVNLANIVRLQPNSQAWYNVACESANAVQVYVTAEGGPPWAIKDKTLGTIQGAANLDKTKWKLKVYAEV